MDDLGAVTAERHDDPGERGRLIIADRAVRRIAEAAALQVPGVVPAAQSAGSIGAALGRGYPRVECDVSGDRVRAEMEIIGRWPIPAAELGARVRDAVTDQLQKLTGLAVDAVDVTIAKVVRGTTPAHRRVQ